MTAQAVYVCMYRGFMTVYYTQLSRQSVMALAAMPSDGNGFSSRLVIHSSGKTALLQPSG